MEAFWVVGLILAYSLPSMVANGRKHPNESAIWMLNLLLGWTAIGWVAALIWALTAVRPAGEAAPSATAKKQPELAPGERLCPKCGAVNGAERASCHRCATILSSVQPNMRECPHCFGEVDSRATACRHCARDIEPLALR